MDHLVLLLSLFFMPDKRKETKYILKRKSFSHQHRKEKRENSKLQCLKLIVVSFCVYGFMKQTMEGKNKNAHHSFCCLVLLSLFLFRSLSFARISFSRMWMHIHSCTFQQSSSQIDNGTSIFCFDHYFLMVHLSYLNN